jgi:chitin synthase
MLFRVNNKRTNRFQCHRWFLEVFCGLLSPNICILLDAGILPGLDSIYNMWRAMDTYTSCGTTISQVNIVLKRGYRDVLQSFRKYRVLAYS